MEIANFLEVLYMEKMLRLWLKDGVLLQKKLYVRDRFRFLVKNVR